MHFYGKNDNITKREIREISISELELKNGDTLWDIGSGSGSVAIYEYSKIFVMLPDDPPINIASGSGRLSRASGAFPFIIFIS